MHLDRSRADRRESDNVVRLREREAEKTQAPRQKQSEDSHASLASSAQDTLGNGLVQAALGPDADGVGPALRVALEMGVAGIGVPGTMDALLGNSGAQEMLASAAIARKAQEEVLPGLDDQRLSILGKGGGSPLPDAVRARMEAAFGHDFAHVRIHTGATVGAAADALNAQAFAIGPDVYFGEGRFAPGTPTGDHLIAHELTHVVQADEGRLPGPTGDGLDVSSPHDAHEVEAERMAGQFVSGEMGGSAAPADAPATAPATVSGPGPVSLKENEATQPPAVDDKDKDKKKWDAPVIGDVPAVSDTAPAPAGLTALDPLTTIGPAPSTKPPEVKPSASTTSAAPSAPTTAASAPSLRAPDGLVDYYMETHWKRTAFDAKVGELGITPEGIGSELDHWLPANTSEGARSALNLAFSVSGGLLDAVAMGVVKSIPGIGALAELATGVKDIWKTVNDYGELDDGWGMAIQIIRSVVDIVGGVAGNLGDTCTLIEDACAASVIGAPIAAIAAGIGEFLGAFELPCDSIKLALDVVSLTRNIIMANRAETAGNFRKAAKYRDLASGDAVNMVVDGIAVACDVVSLVSANALPAQVGENAAEAVRDAGGGLKGALSKLGKKLPKMDKDELETGAADAGGKLGGLTKSFGNLKYRMGLGDAMALSNDGLFGGHYISPDKLPASTGEASKLLSGAREGSIQHFQEVYGKLEGQDADWNQKLINDIVAPEGRPMLDTYSDLLSPSAWIRMQLQGIRGLATMGNDLSNGALAGLLKGGASILQDLIQPAVDGLNKFIKEQKQPIDDYLLGVTAGMQQQKVTLEGLRGALGQTTKFSEWMKKIADQGGSLHGFTEKIISKIDGMKVTKESLGIPNWVPEFTYKWVLDKVNGLVTKMADRARKLRDETLAGIDKFVEEQMAWVQARIAEVQEAVKEGGKVETMLQGAYDQFTDMARKLAEMMDSMDGIPIDVRAAASWLTDKAKEAEDRTFTERLVKLKDFLTGTAQPYVDDWRAKFGPDVEQAFHPEVPVPEQAAFNQAYTIVIKRIDKLTGLAADEVNVREFVKLDDYRKDADNAKAKATAQTGKKGQSALDDFWEAGDDLAQVATSVGV